MRSKTVLVMWEHTADRSPVWARSPDLEIGQLDVADLGVDDGLRKDLAAWNRAAETAASATLEPDGPQATPSWWRASAVHAFALAARLQRALGAEWTVWCAAGGGDGFLRGADAARHWRATDGRARLLLRSTALTVFIEPAGEHAPIRVPPHLRAEVSAWSAFADRVAMPGFDDPGALDPAEHRARGLELAGRLQADLPHAQLLWFGGDDAPG